MVTLKSCITVFRDRIQTHTASLKYYLQKSELLKEIAPISTVKHYFSIHIKWYKDI